MDLSRQGLQLEAVPACTNCTSKCTGIDLTLTERFSCETRVYMQSNSIRWSATHLTLQVYSAISHANYRMLCYATCLCPIFQLKRCIFTHVCMLHDTQLLFKTNFPAHNNAQSFVCHKDEHLLQTSFMLITALTVLASVLPPCNE